MIAYVEGKITHIYNGICYVNVHGVGYRVYITEATGRQLTEGEERLLYTYTNVREDAMHLFGFLTEEEYDLFTLLISVSGIGPKVALGMLSAMEPARIQEAIAAGNTAILVKLPGIGKKSAERLVLELKDKVTALQMPMTKDDTSTIVDVVFAPPKGVAEETIMALQSLGYSEKEIAPVVESLAPNYDSVQELVRATLQAMGKQRK